MTKISKAGKTVAGFVAGAALAVLVVPAHAQPECQLQKLAELKVLNDEGAPQVLVGINGHDAIMTISTASARTMLLASAARTLGVQQSVGLSRVRLITPVGVIAVRDGTIAHLTLGEASIPNLIVLVAGEGRPGDPAGELGWYLLSHWDLEFDLPHHAIRIIRPVGCRGDKVVYWTGSYNRVAIKPINPDHISVEFPVTINGQESDAILDSADKNTTVRASAKALAGIPLTPINETAGHETELRSVADIDSLNIGGEDIRHPRLEVVDPLIRYKGVYSDLNGLADAAPKVTFGADFLRAHRVLIAPDQRQMYFTYEGGVVFRPPAVQLSATQTAVDPAH